MEFRRLGASGFKVPVLTFGTGTFGGKGEFFKAWGGMQVEEAARMVDVCLEAGVTMFDSADIIRAESRRAFLAGRSRAGAKRF
jgi:aryl-alcohol dehydrogenase-like predicted oxidoreductase